LSSDHGAIPLPEYLSSNGIESERLDHDGFKSRIKRIIEQLGDDIIYSGNGFYFPRHFTNDQKEDALQLIKKEMIGLNALGYIFSREEILLMKGINPFNRRLKHMIHPQMSPDVILVLREYFTSRSPLGTTHGTPYNYDTHVPLIFSHINIKPARISRPVATVDIAPTIGSLLNVSIPEDVDGNSLQEISP
jgi:arylsulfatase A-like enzyme